jgi:hypothetical protein
MMNRWIDPKLWIVIVPGSTPPNMRKSGKVEEAETDEEAEAGRRFKLQLQEN